MDGGGKEKAEVATNKDSIELTSSFQEEEEDENGEKEEVDEAEAEVKSLTEVKEAEVDDLFDIAA